MTGLAAVFGRKRFRKEEPFPTNGRDKKTGLPFQLGRQTWTRGTSEQPSRAKTEASNRSQSKQRESQETQCGERSDSSHMDHAARRLVRPPMASARGGVLFMALLDPHISKAASRKAGALILLPSQMRAAPQPRVSHGVVDAREHFPISTDTQILPSKVLAPTHCHSDRSEESLVSSLEAGSATSNCSGNRYSCPAATFARIGAASRRIEQPFWSGDSPVSLACS